MIKVSDLIGKPLLDLSKAAVFTVGNVFFDYKKNTAVALKVICPDDDCEYKYVKFGDIYKIGEAITVKNSAYIFSSQKNDFGVNPINCDAYSQDGKFLGVIKDVILEGASIKAFSANGEEFFYPIISASERAVIFNDTGKPFIVKTKITAPDDRTVKLALNKAEKPDEKKSEALTEDKINLQPSVEIPSKPDFTTVIHSPQSAPVTKYEFLLGKRADKDIFTNNGELIVGINEIITSDVIRFAKGEGKLIQLAMHSR